MAVTTDGGGTLPTDGAVDRRSEIVTGKHRF